MNSSLQVWIDAARPKTLPLALVSIMTGSALAFAHGTFSWSTALLAIATATLLQILSNLANDYGDAVKGTDNQARLGPTRALQSGAITAQAMRTAIALNILLTIVCGLWLVLHAIHSWQTIALFIGFGALAIIAAIAYTVGNKPYGYFGLGDISVFIFFGLLGVCGTYFLHTESHTSILNPALDAALSHQTGHQGVHFNALPLLLLPAIGCGLLAVAVLNVNNMRDIENDAACGKRTLAVRLGFARAKQYHLAVLLTGWLAFVAYLGLNHAAFGLASLMLLGLVALIKHARAVWQSQTPNAIAPLMPQVVKVALINNLIFATVVIAQTLLG
ncbi:1,4-dihydroxy-2-naphthoate octaprenyltransferase [Vibrio sp. SM6]|uniref:1,4-dihydroxy-2-naphthoate octaprenyltransferase n=1 Tax=Vibrio agarilyticus TaxID=2726741 RepID=A0A7X8TRF5_9VIBR|nr:1,4-dihydroxy-2-naphthoate octaprenyltransferase [Vibrio agarilyticus]NLS13505.1 1,4-dihydroxy-2-naphthoate octaprenyltransferase [Vibrio agarilyticus]